MTDRRSAIDAVLDLVLYAPVGLALVASEEIPKLAAKGRAQLGDQLSMAKVVGQFAVAQGRRQLAPRPPFGSRAGGRTRPRTTSSAPSWARPKAAPGGGAPVGGAGGIDEPGADLAQADLSEPLVVDAGTAAGPSTQLRPDSGPADGMGLEAGAAPGPEEADPSGLAIPGYDSLAASQVVARLAGLSGAELAAVGAYESAHRARRTILTRIRQLQER